MREGSSHSASSQPLGRAPGRVREPVPLGASSIRRSEDATEARGGRADGHKLAMAAVDAATATSSRRGVTSASLARGVQEGTFVRGGRPAASEGEGAAPAAAPRSGGRTTTRGTIGSERSVAPSAPRPLAAGTGIGGRATVTTCVSDTLKFFRTEFPYPKYFST